MARPTKVLIVFVTCRSTAEARKIAATVVAKRLAACVNIVGSPVQSIYRWKGKVEAGRERLLVMKTSSQRVKELEEEVRRLHSYEVPEFLVVGVRSGSKEYLRWLLAAVR